MRPVLLLVTYTAKPYGRERFLQQVRQSGILEAIRQEEGCLSYDYFLSEEDDRQILLVELVLEIGRSVNIVMVRGLTTAGDVWFPVLVGIFSMWAVAVFGGWLLGSLLGLGLVGIWIAMACDECLRGVLFVIRFRRGAWKKKRLVE